MAELLPSPRRLCRGRGAGVTSAHLLRDPRLPSPPAPPPPRAGGGRGLYLDGGDEGSGEVGAEAGGQGQLADVLVLSQRAGDGLLAQQLQAGHPVLHAHHVQGRAGRHQQPGVPVAPADGDDGALRGREAGDASAFPLVRKGRPRAPVSSKRK